MFLSLTAAAQIGQLGLVKGTVASTNEEVAIICVVLEDESGYNMVPLGHLCNEDPFKYYIPDLGSLKEEGTFQ